MQFTVGGVEAATAPTGGFGTDAILPRNGGSVSVQLMEPARSIILRLGIEPGKYFPGKVVRATGLVEPDPASSSFQIRVRDLTQFLVINEQGSEENGARADPARLIGGWVIANDDSQRQGEEWLISEDEIVMHPNLYGFRIHNHYHLLDATKSPKQIDIIVTKTNLEYLGVIKGIYALDDNGERLHRFHEPAAEQPKAKGGRPTPIVATLRQGSMDQSATHHSS